MSPDILWAGWLVLFLVYEVSAAFAKPKGDTLSENVWDWFGVRGGGHLVRRAFLCLFMVVLTSHFVFAWPGGAAVIVTGIPVGAVIAVAMVRRRLGK